MRNERSITFWRIFYLQKEEAFEEQEEACLDRKSEVRERKIEKRMTERKVVVRIFLNRHRNIFRRSFLISGETTNMFTIDCSFSFMLKNIDFNSGYYIFIFS